MYLANTTILNQPRQKKIYAYDEAEKDKVLADLIADKKNRGTAIDDERDITKQAGVTITTV